MAASAAETGRITGQGEIADTTMCVILGVGAGAVFALMGVKGQDIAKQEIERANSINLQTSEGVELHDIYIRDANSMQAASNISFVLVPVSIAIAAVSLRALRRNS